MTIVLVHGNLETSLIWEMLIPHLDKFPILRLSLPGYGAALPDGFGCTPIEYRDWLISELEKVVKDAGPVDLVGHDWGGVLTVAVAMSRADLLRTWSTDTIGMLDPDYEWHPLAKIWQTEEIGEGWVSARLKAPLEDNIAWFAERGVEEFMAEKLALGFDATMGRSMLRLYRSAKQPFLAIMGADLGAAASRPGLALIPSEDHVGTIEQRHRSAARAGATIEILDGLHHWWMAERPELGAAALIRFWKER